jgi:hypothetical protein
MQFLCLFKSSCRYITRLCFFAILVISIISVPTEAKSTPHFGSSIVFVGNLGAEGQLRPFDEMLLPVVISRSGKLVVAVANQRSGSDKITSLHIWDLRAIDPEGGFFSPPPSSSLDLDSSKTEFAQVSIAFSPDEQFLALWFDTQIQLLSVPDMQVIKTILVNREPMPWGLTWTADSNQLLIQDEGTWVLWNIHTDATHRKPVTGNHWVTLFGDEWLVLPLSSRDGPELFTICSQQLEQCTPYSYPYSYSGEFSASNQNRRIIVTQRRNDENMWVLGVWTRQENGEYVLTEGLFGETGIVSTEIFSPSGQFLYLRTLNGAEIWNLATVQSVQGWADSREAFYGVDDLAWLASDEFFVTLENHNFERKIMLYHVGQETPLDTLNLSSIVEAQDTSIDAELYGIRGVSDDGCWAAVGIGPAVLMIPVVHE